MIHLLNGEPLLFLREWHIKWRYINQVLNLNSIIFSSSLSFVCPYFSLQALAGEISPFLCSGSHQVQRDCQPSALNCFVEAMSQCVPPIPIRPCVLKYLGKTHNLWFRSTLMLEHQAFEKGLSLQIKPKQTTEFYEQESITPPQQVRYYTEIPYEMWREKRGDSAVQ